MKRNGVPIRAVLMSRRRITLLLVLFFLSLNPYQRKAVGMDNAVQSAAGYSVYLPMIFNPAWFTIIAPVIYAPNQYSYTAVGEVRNSTQIQYALTLEARIYDAYENKTITETVNTLFPATLPGQPNPFLLGLGSPDDIIENVSVQSAEPIALSTYTAVTIVSKQYWYRGYGWGYLTGVVRNEGSYPVTSVVGNAWSFEYPSWAGIGIDKPSLQPGEESTFTSSIMPGRSDVTAEMYQAAFQGVISP